MTFLHCLALLAILQEGSEPPTIESPTWIEKLHGRIALRYRLRRVPDTDDNDLYEYIRLRYGNEETDPITLSASARIAEDLDGNRGGDGFAARSGPGAGAPSIDQTVHRLPG